jgi:hypothetical protein
LDEPRKTNKENRKRDSLIEKGDTYVGKWFGNDIQDVGEVLYNNNEDEMQFTFIDCLVTVKTFVFDGEHMISLEQLIFQPMSKAR